MDFYYNTSMDCTYVGKYSTLMCFHPIDFTHEVYDCSKGILSTKGGRGEGKGSLKSVSIKKKIVKNQNQIG
jgi:hypothetical protein